MRKGNNTLIRLKVATRDIAFLVQVMEGYSHIGVVTTTNPKEGEVMVQVTPDTYALAREILVNLPVELEFVDNE